MDEVLNEVVLGKIRVELRNDDIKLWNEPYTSCDGAATDHVNSLASTYSSRLKLQEDEVFVCLNHLRVFALERLQQNNKFKFENIATLRIKFSPKTSAPDHFTSVETKLDVSGKNLIDIIANKLKVDPGLLKLVYLGKIIIPGIPLISQGVQHNKTIMCIIFSADTKQQTEQAEMQMDEVRKARRGAELLASSSSSTVQNYDVHITDQNGRSLDLPDNEKSSLVVALGLHEKGRGVLKKKEYSFALLFLLEADTEFRQCRAEILNLVDNFAILCLDISWCYLCLQNLDALPDVSERLKKSEESFNKSYGKSLQRLLNIKGSSGHEVVLFVRLYVLQGVVAYHEGKYREARDLLFKAQSYTSNVNVDEEKMIEMINLGFTVKESRLALRACEGNITAASQHVLERREEKEKILKEETEKSRRRKLAKMLGKCANGNDVDIDLYEKMVNILEFDKHMSAEALKQCNNDLQKAMELIYDKPELLKLTNHKVTHEMVQQVSAVGFDPVSARAALAHFNGDNDRSIEYLLTNQGVVPSVWLGTMEFKTAAHSSKAGLSNADHEAIQKLAKDVNKDEDDYLDLHLDEELGYISEYLAKVNSVI